MDGVLAEISSAMDMIAALRDSQEAIESKFKNLLQAVADGIERVDRSERRVIATLKRGRKELAEHGLESAGLEAEVAELQLVDGTGGEEQGMPAVREEVAADGGTPSSVPGVSVEQLLRARGL